MMERRTEVQRLFQRRKSHWSAKRISRVRRLLSARASVASESFRHVLASKEQYACIHFVHVYSLSPSPIRVSIILLSFSASRQLSSGTSPLVRACEESSRNGEKHRHRLYRCVRSSYWPELVHQSTLASVPI